MRVAPPASPVRRSRRARVQRAASRPRDAARAWQFHVVSAGNRGARAHASRRARTRRLACAAPFAATRCSGASPRAQARHRGFKPACRDSRVQAARSQRRKRDAACAARFGRCVHTHDEQRASQARAKLSSTPGPNGTRRQSPPRRPPRALCAAAAQGAAACARRGARSLLRQRDSETCRSRNAPQMTQPCLPRDGAAAAPPEDKGVAATEVAGFVGSITTSVCYCACYALRMLFHLQQAPQAAAVACSAVPRVGVCAGGGAARRGRELLPGQVVGARRARVALRCRPLRLHRLRQARAAAAVTHLHTRGASVLATLTRASDAHARTAST